MATTFDVFYLGTFAELDPVEGNYTSENAESLVGQTLGGANAPLSSNVVTMSQYNSDYEEYYIDNSQANDQFQIDGGAPLTFDGLVDYNATITYADGTTANITAVVFQATDGQTFLAPEYVDNNDQYALEAKPIQSLTLNSVAAAGDDLISDRVVGDYDDDEADDDDEVAADGVVDGSAAGDDMALGYTDSHGDQITGGADNINGAGGNDTIRADGGDDTVSGGDGQDVIYGQDGADSIEGGGNSDFISGGTGNDTIYGDADSNPGEEWQIHSSWNAYFLGNGTDLDGDESTGYSHNAASLLGSYDSSDTPISGQTVRVDISDFDGDGGVDENNEMASGAASEMKIDGVEQVLDNNAGYQATVTFEDGSTGTFTAVVFQTVDGDFYLAPEYSNNDDMALLSSKPIQSISLDSVFSDNNYLMAERWDSIAAEDGGDDTIYAGEGDDVVYGEMGNDTIFGEGGQDTLDGGEGDDKLHGGTGDDVFVVSGGNDTIGDFNTGNTGALRDGDNTNNDFVDLSGHYDHVHEMHADLADDGVLNQSNTLDAKGNVVDYSNNTQFGDGSLAFTGNVDLTSDNTGVVCFTTGTMILTPQGERPIESLKPGDLVTTMDSGPQPIVWIGNTSLTRSQLGAQPKLRPIHINAGVLGVDRPLLVSPQHGVLLPGTDILVRATHLHRFVKGTRVAQGKQDVTYFHIMFERHQIVFSNGSPSESLYPGPMALQAMNAGARAEIDALFPGVLGVSVQDKLAQLYGETAREVVRKPTLGVA